VWQHQKQIEWLSGKEKKAGGAKENFKT